MSEKMCCVPGCLESGRTHKVLHSFPNPEKEWERFNSWLMAIGGDILSLTNEHIYRCRRVCHSHFQESHCCRYNRISNIAVPTMNIPDPLQLPNVFTNRRPLITIQQPLLCLPSTSTSLASAVLVEKSPNKENYPPCPVEDTQRSVLQTSVNVDPAVELLFERNLEKENDPFYQQDGGQKSEPKLVNIGCNKEKVSKKGNKYISHAEQKLYKKLLTLRVRMSKVRSKAKKQSLTLKAAKNITSNEDFLKTMENLPSAARVLTLMQFRELKKKHCGRRFTLEDKMFSLSIFKQSPKAYRFLRKILILPAPQTLAKLINQANVEPGINSKIFAQLKDKAKKMKIEEQLCILLFDEMSLKASIQYNERKDKVTGFITDGIETKADYADHAQVFMIRGLINNYKQPVAYTFSLAATKGPELAKQLKNIIKEVQKTGLIVVATICDQGANNRAAIKLLMQETQINMLRENKEMKDNIFIIEGQEVVPLYDPPHMLKCIRNNMLTKDLIYILNGTTGTAKWQHLEWLHRENPGYKGMRLIPKMTDNHIIPNKIAKMKVKYASQVFSQTVAKNMGYLADKGILPTECKDTANLLLFFDNLFDSVNGSYNKQKHGKPLLRVVTPYSEHMKFWNEAKKTLKSMKFIDKNEKTDKSVSLSNWVWTLEGIQVLLKKLKAKYSVNSIWMRHLNQDPIENFFGAIRSHGCRNNNPTPDKFESAYTTLLINNLSSVHAPGRNCEKDFCNTLHALIVTDDCKDMSPTSFNRIPDVTLCPLNEKNKPQIIAPLQYVSGYFLREVKRKIFKSCQICKNDMFCTNELEYIKYREYAGRSWLCSPSYLLINCISNFQDIFNCVLKSELHTNNIKHFIKTIILIYVDFDFIKCEIHKEMIIEFLINISSRFFIHHYCKNINKIMSGRKDCDDDEDKNQVNAKKMYHKSFKRK